MTVHVVGIDGKSHWIRGSSRSSKAMSGSLLMQMLYVDVTEQVELQLQQAKEQKKLAEKYAETVAYHHSVMSQNTILSGHCNITQNKILELNDPLGLGLLERFSDNRDAFFSAFARLIPNAQEQQLFLEQFLVRPLEKSFLLGVTSHQFSCTIKLTEQEPARYIDIHVDVAASPESKDLIGFFTATDVTAQRLTQAIIKKAVEQEYDYIAYIDTLHNQYTVFRNEYSAAILPSEKGSDFAAAAREYALRCVVPAEQERVLREEAVPNVLEQLEKSLVYTIHYTAVQKDGSLGKKELHFSFIDPKNKTVLLTQRDVTARYREEQRKNEILSAALTAAEQANMAKSDFLSRMSHEIRTPMNAIIGMAAIAAQSMGDDAQVADCISKIGISSRFLLSLINDILDMSRIESGKMLLKSEKIPFEEFINGINSICHSQASAKNVDYECTVGPDVEAYYIGDAMKLQQVAINIISNAIKFTPDGGKVSIQILQHRKTKNDAVVRFIINDTGCGMSEEFIPHLFEPFAQENVGASLYSGTGLGLAICKSIVDMMDGKIEVRSIKNIGTEFTVDVKLGISEETRARYLKKPQFNFTALKTLVVDDDIAVCESAMITLKTMGVHAEWVDSGRKAIERVRDKWERKEHYDMILVDWKMPDMDGIETAKRIRKIVGPDVTIIIMTAYDWASIEHEAKLAGVNLLISKPMFQSSLISAFETVLGQKSQAQAPEAAQKFDFSGKRVLLVEDHPLNVEVATKLLTKKALAVEHAGNGLNAIEMVTMAPEGYYDAILMDIRMPVMDGLTAATSIRHLSRQDVKKVPIIAMTANAFEDDIDKSRAAGMNAHLTKPIDPKMLYQTLYNFIYAEENQCDE